MCCVAAWSSSGSRAHAPPPIAFGGPHRRWIHTQLNHTSRYTHTAQAYLYQTLKTNWPSKRYALVTLPTQMPSLCWRSVWLAPKSYAILHPKYWHPEPLTWGVDDRLCFFFLGPPGPAQAPAMAEERIERIDLHKGEEMTYHTIRGHIQQSKTGRKTRRDKAA